MTVFKWVVIALLIINIVIAFVFNIARLFIDITTAASDAFIFNTMKDIPLVLLYIVLKLSRSNDAQ